MMKILMFVFALILIAINFLPSYDEKVASLQSTDNSIDAPTEVSANTITRDEFKKLVDGQPSPTLLNLVGTPDSTSTSGDTQYWYYKNKTIDPITGKVDSSIQVVIGEHNTVEHVNFQAEPSRVGNSLPTRKPK